jgi:uncharacterized membrane protein YfhO
MSWKADYVAGGVFIAFGILVFILGWDLPFGTISAPGAGMLPKLMAGLMIVFAIGIMAVGAAEHLADLPWSDGKHAILVVGITAAAVAVYTWLGFIITMTLLVFGLQVIVERKNILTAALYACGLTLFAYWLFGVALKAPLERGLLWF